MLLAMFFCVRWFLIAAKRSLIQQSTPGRQFTSEIYEEGEGLRFFLIFLLCSV